MIFVWANGKNFAKAIIIMTSLWHGMGTRLTAYLLLISPFFPLFFLTDGGGGERGVDGGGMVAGVGGIVAFSRSMKPGRRNGSRPSLVNGHIIASSDCIQPWL